MRVLNEETNNKVENITIYLNASEALELRDSLTDLINNPEHHHNHIPSSDFKNEITICVYDLNDLSGFDERSKKLILEDE